MNRTLMVAGVLAVVVLALLTLACGSDPTPTSVPATPAPPAPTTAVVSATEAPTEVPTAAPTTAVPVATPRPAPTTAPAPTPTAAAQAVAPAPAPATPEPTPMPVEPVEVDPSDAYFAMDRVLEVSIVIDADDWDALRHQTRTFEDLVAEIEKYELSRPFANIYTWFSATVTIDGETHREVGVRKKGFLGSQSDTKPSLKLRYDKYVDGQSLGGEMERMTLNNSVQDPSMVNTCLAYQVFAAAGLPSPRCNFATVAVNGKNLGLYVHVEELKKPFLARHFDSAEGNLYEGTVSDFIPSHRGTFEKKTNEDEGDWSDVNAVMAALQDPSDAGLVALGKIVDLDRFLSFWATEVLVGHWDGYTGDRNNYHLYREPDGKFVFIPWGADDTFHLKDDPNPFDNISNPPPSVLAFAAIPNRLYNTPEWRRKYAERLKEILNTSWDEDELLASVDAMAAIVAEHALPDAKSEAAKDTERVRKFILKRKGELLADLTPEPPNWPEPEQAATSSGEFESSGVPASGVLEVKFQTVWGSSDSANPLGEGTVYELNQDLEWVATEGDVGVTAGPASPQEEADIGVKDAALITVMGLYPDFTIQGLTLWLPVERLSPGANLSFGGDGGLGGVIWQIPAGKSEPEGFIPVTGGDIELTEAGTEPGAAIAGLLHAVWGSEGETGGPGSGTVEVGFDTTWGSHRNLDLQAEGKITHLKVNEVEQPAEGVVATAGHASETGDQYMMTDAGDLASLTFGVFHGDGTFTMIVLVMPMAELVAGATLVIGKDRIVGEMRSLPAGPDYLSPFCEGVLELEETGTEEGSRIVGSFTGSFRPVPLLPEYAVLDVSEIDDGMGCEDSVCNDTGEIGLVINEVAAKGNPMDWFELYNVSNCHIALANFVVADDLEDAGKRVAFPDGLVIAPGAYLQFEVDKDGWPGFSLGGDEELGVWTSEGVLVDSVDWDEGDSGENQSYARLPDGTGEFHTVVSTPGEENEHHH